MNISSSFKSLALEVQDQSPISRLPIEMLGKIFTFTLPNTQFIRPKSSEAPLLICAVSGSSRTVALSTPELWCSLEIGNDSGDDAIYSLDPKTDLKILRHWVLNAKDCPLSLAFKYKLTRPTDLLGFFNMFLDSAIIGGLLGLLRVVLIKRCEEIYLSLPEVHGSFLVNLLNKRLPLLKKIFIKCYSLPTNNMDFNSSSSGLILPQETSQTWFPELTIFNLCGFIANVGDAWKILCHSPNLKCAAFSFGGADSSCINGSLIHHKLEMLILNQFFNIDVSSLLNNITTPALETLHIIFLYEESVASSLWRNLRNLFMRSGSCQLTDLDLHSAKGLTIINEEDLIDLLESIPNLNRLCVFKTELQDSFLERLTMMPSEQVELSSLSIRGSGSTSLCPRLQKIILSGRLSLSVHSIAATVISRAQDPHNQCRFELIDFNSMDGRLPSMEELMAIPGVLECVERGLDLKMLNH